MARHRRFDRYEEREVARFALNPDTKRGILVVLFFVVSALLFLSFFGLAGRVGITIDAAVATLFGWDRWLLPFVFLLLGASLTLERVALSAYNYIGLLFFFLSFNGFINLVAFGSAGVMQADDLSLAGGYVGLFLYQIFTALMGFWGALVFLIALLIVSLLLLFNTSLRSLFFVHRHVFGWMGERLHRHALSPQESETPLPDEDGEDKEDDEQAPQPEERGEAFHKKSIAGAPVEQVLSVKQRRKIEIPFDLLEYRGNKASAGDITRSREIIQKTFSQFGIDVEMADTSIGPTVTQYTLRPANGVKLARIVALHNDLALALAAHPIRIEAPIPGKALVGIEVPNQAVATVCLRDLLESKEFRRRESALSFPLGKDVSGMPWVVRLEKMPHMLVAGATGSGKSVCLNTIIVSLLYQNGPDDLKFIFVDPKRVELTVYEGIPHLLIPPITKVDDTINALKWAVREMERRLDVLSRFGVRDLDSYNAKAEAKIPKLVIIIDELADLMASSRHEVEGLIVRIAQMARAVGIHLVLATQRPSVDVITGLIKANIPARAAFAVASQVDSRTILDVSGAEKLCGRGDMLYTSAELAKPKRLQGAFVSDSEIERVVKFLKQAGAPDYNYHITEHEGTGTIFDSSHSEEPLLEDAIAVVVEAQKASTSLLQRRLKIGYSRAARIIDMLEEHGVVGPPDGAKPRDVLVKEWPPSGRESSGEGEENKQVDEAPLADSDNGDDWFIDETRT